MDPATENLPNVHNEILIPTKSHQCSSDSDTKTDPRLKQAASRQANGIPLQNSRHSTEMRIKVNSPLPRNSVYPAEIRIVNPPAIGNRSRNANQLTQSRAETRVVVTKMAIPELESPSLGRARNQRSYSTDVMGEDMSGSLRRRQYYQPSSNNTFGGAPSLPKPLEPPQSPCHHRKSSHGHRNHQSRRYSQSQSRSRASRSLGPEYYSPHWGGVPLFYPMPAPAASFSPGCYNPYHPFSCYYPHECPRLLPPMPYSSSSVIPIYYNSPQMPHSVSGMSPLVTGTLPRHSSRRQRPPASTDQFRCKCCPNGIHISTVRSNSRAFNFESDSWDSEDALSRDLTPYSQNGVIKRPNIRQLVDLANYLTPGKRPGPGQPPYEITDRRNESAYDPPQRYRDRNTADIPPKPELAMPSMPPTRADYDDNFPADFAYLTDLGNECTYEIDESQGKPVPPPPDIKIVIGLANNASSTAMSPTQVATAMKKAMDATFGPVWQVIASTEAYGSSMAIIRNHCLHFKAFGWTFLIWRTSFNPPV